MLEGAKGECLTELPRKSEGELGSAIVVEELAGRENWLTGECRLRGSRRRPGAKPNASHRSKQAVQTVF